MIVSLPPSASKDGIPPVEGNAAEIVVHLQAA